ncbi:MAG: hypothetical protein V1871_03480 [Planctomycetota bacterium]
MDIMQIHNKVDPERTAGGNASKGRTLSEQRKCDLDIPVRFVLVSVPEGNIIEEGSARVCNINSSEIEVSDIELPNRSLPLNPFQVTLFFQYGLSEKIHMLCSVQWINSNGSISLGLHIDQIPEKHRFRLNEFMKKFENNTKKILIVKKGENRYETH